MDVARRDSLRMRALQDDFTAARQLRGIEAHAAMRQAMDGLRDLRTEQRLRQNPEIAKWL